MTDDRVDGLLDALAFDEVPCISWIDGMAMTAGG